MNKNTYLRNKILFRDKLSTNKKYFLGIDNKNPFNIFYFNKIYDKHTKIISNTSNKSLRFIISYYNENLDWLRNYNNVLIYNKGNNEILGFDNIKINNVGRDVHTKFYHIYNNYENLDDYLVFLQAFPYDHSPNLNTNVNKLIDKINKGNIIKFEFISELIIDGCLFYHDTYEYMNECYKKIFGHDIKNGINKDMMFGSGCQFIVSKENVLKHDKEFYYKIIKMLDYENAPLELYELDRFLGRIFS